MKEILHWAHSGAYDMARVAIIGSGPAALMAAEVASAAGHEVIIYEKRNGPSRKLFIAGSSGLNITHAMPAFSFAQQYKGAAGFWTAMLSQYSPTHWLEFIHGLGLKTFKGTSDRYFIAGMKALPLVRAWRKRLTERGVTWIFNHECTGFAVDAAKKSVTLNFAGGESATVDAACFCLGGATYEPEEPSLRWPRIFTEHGLAFTPFTAANVGYRVAFPPAFIKEAEGLPLKNIRLTTARGSRLGELVVTGYGLEGTPIYAVGDVGPAHIDLKPDLTTEQILAKCALVRENLSPIRRIKKTLNLSPAAFALLYHSSTKEIAKELPKLVALLKQVPLDLLGPQPMVEAISSAGGLDLKECDDTMMLKKFPGVFAAGEMLNWDAPTGGFLIQGCVTLGAVAGRGMVTYLGGPMSAQSKRS